MIILAIETSCDETSVAILEAKKPVDKAGGTPSLKVLSNVVSSQVKIHAHWGGVVPSLARREHEKNLIPVFLKALKKTGLLKVASSKQQVVKGNTKYNIQDTIYKILAREPELLKIFLETIPTLKIPPIDAIAVTVGPGLEPALWVGLNFAKALATAWDKPLIPVNHMEGHILAFLLAQKSEKNRGRRSLLKPACNALHSNAGREEPELVEGDGEGVTLKSDFLNNKQTSLFPAIALLVSGGHTELILMRDWLKYETIGQTRDDAAGECFDKSARLLGLPYPGGPQVAKLARLWTSDVHTIKLPRPMLNSGDFDFSFSGLKTSVLYKSRDLNLNNTGCVIPCDEKEKLIQEFCHEIQQSIIDVLISKTLSAAKKYNAQTIILGGGVAANKELRRQFKLAVKLMTSDVVNFKKPTLFLPPAKLTTDNAAMIGAAALLRAQKQKKSAIGGIKNFSKLKANGNLELKQSHGFRIAV